MFAYIYMQIHTHTHTRKHIYVHTPVLGSSFYGRTILQIPYRANVEYQKWEMECKHCISDRELTVESSSGIWGAEEDWFGLGFFKKSF